jgi:hypothetical protein
VRDAGVTYTDAVGRAWAVREFVSYGEVPPAGVTPRVVRSGVIFESDEERRLADDAPLDWRARPAALDELFARARRLTERHTGLPTGSRAAGEARDR